MSHTTTTADIRRAAERFETRLPWLESRHSFSFGDHYDPANTHYGLLLVSKDDIVRSRHGLQHPPARGTWRSCRGYGATVTRQWLTTPPPGQ